MLAFRRASPQAMRPERFMAFFLQYR